MREKETETNEKRDYKFKQICVAALKVMCEVLQSDAS